MATVLVTIDGKSYRMACGDGQEAHLEGLAAQIDAKVAEMKASFGEIGDMRLTIMAAIMVADELSEVRGQLDAVQAAKNRLEARIETAETGRAQAEQTAADAIRQLANRLNTLASSLGEGSAAA
jgi:cell division protein ZapA